jgi:hypothetical protein
MVLEKTRRLWYESAMNKKFAFITLPVCFFIGFLGANLPNFSTSLHAKPAPILKSLEGPSTDYSKGALTDIGLCRGLYGYIPDEGYPSFHPEVSRLNPRIAVYHIEARPPPAVS